jgi:enamine deaminase RidA (YjgF/YER057c/UK114 family)
VVSPLDPPAGPFATGHRASSRGGDIVWVGAHAAATDDLEAAARATIGSISEALLSEGSDLVALTRLGVYHHASLDAGTIRGAIRRALPHEARPVVSLQAVDEPALSGAALVIDAAAASGRRVVIGDGEFPRAVRVGDRVWVGATAGAGDGILAQTSDAIERLRATAAEAGVALDDCVKMNIGYVGTGSEADWEPTAKLRGAAFAEPAAAATGIPFPGLPLGALTQLEMLSIVGSVGVRRHGWPAGHWDWPIHLPWKHACRAGALVTVGGQVSLDHRGQVVDPGDLARQTATALGNIERCLATVDAQMSDVRQVTAFYEGGPADLETILSLTRRAFGDPPPPIVPVPLPFLAYQEMVVEIEVIAVVD